MNEIEINKILHEAQGKFCWHEPMTGWQGFDPNGVRCKSCGNRMMNLTANPSFTRNWSDYGPLLEWAMKQEWWPKFVNKPLSDKGHQPWLFPIAWLNPLTGSTALAEFLKEKETKHEY